MKLSRSLSAAAMLLAAMNVNAMSVDITNDFVSQVAGAVDVDFDAAPPAEWSYTGGAEFNTSISGITARPFGSTGDFWSIGISGNQGGPGIVTIDGGTDYYGFLFGSADSYNTVQFYDGAVLLGSYAGSELVNPANGNQAVSYYVNAFAGVGETFTSVRFLSTANAFESDNHAYFAARPEQVAAVPELETYALMLAGLASVGFVARRRRPE